MTDMSRRTYVKKPARQLKRTGNHLRAHLGGEEALRQLGQSFLARPIWPSRSKRTKTNAKPISRLMGVPVPSLQEPVARQATP